MSTRMDDLGGEHFYRSAVDARAALEELFRTFFDRSLAHMDAETDTRDSPAPGLAAAVTPGLGKTSTVLRLLAEVAPAFLREGHVAVYVPTHDLADRAFADFARRAPEVTDTCFSGVESTREIVEAQRRATRLRNSSLHARREIETTSGSLLTARACS